MNVRAGPVDSDHALANPVVGRIDRGLLTLNSTSVPKMSEFDSFSPPDSPEYVRFASVDITPWDIS